MPEDAVHRLHHARDLFDQGKVDDAVRELRRLRAENDAPSAVFLGWLYETGAVAGSPDLAEARASYQVAADANDSIGEYYLGSFLLRQGDVGAAIEQLERAAEQNYAPALYSLGMVHVSGRGVARDEAEAVRCMTMAAEIGHPYAQRWLAIRALRGGDGFAAFFRALWWFVSIPRLAFRLASDEAIDPNLLP